MSSKPLTKHQQDHLVLLNDRFADAQNTMEAFKRERNEFIAYLSREHEAPPPEWDIKDITVGFVKVETKEETPNQQQPPTP